MKSSSFRFLRPNSRNWSNLFSTQTPLQSAGPVSCHLKSRSVIRFTGPDTIKFLQGLVTNDVRSLGVSETAAENSVTPNMPVAVTPSVYAALLTPQGRFLYDFFLYNPSRSFAELGQGPGPTKMSWRFTRMLIVLSWMSSWIP